MYAFSSMSTAAPHPAIVQDGGRDRVGEDDSQPEDGKVSRLLPATRQRGRSDFGWRTEDLYNVSLGLC